MKRPRLTIAGAMLAVAVIAGGLGSYRAGRRAEQLARPRPVLVWVTPRGSRWHRVDCRHLKGGGLAVALEEAKADGRLRACAVCRPPP